MILAYYFFLLSKLAIATPEIEIAEYREEAIRPFALTLHNWSASAYRKFPFLYASEGCGDVLPYHILCNDRDAFVLLAEKNGKQVGMLAGYPLDSPFITVQYSPSSQFDAMRQKGYNPSEIFYVASFLIIDEERGNKTLAEAIYAQAASLAKKSGKKQMCYFATIREENHPLKPSAYIPVEPWDHLRQSFRSMGVSFELSWPTLQADGSVQECASMQELFILDL